MAKKEAPKKAAKKAAPVKKAAAKKAPAKKVEPIKLGKISAKKISNKIIVVIDGKSHTKVTKDEKEFTSIQNKILLYNKKPTVALRDTILRMISKEVVEVETKEATKKGLKNQVKKAARKKLVPNKVAKKEVDVLAELEKGLAEGKFTEDQILERLTKKAQVVEEVKKEVIAPVVTSNPRTGEH